MGAGTLGHKGNRFMKTRAWLAGLAATTLIASVGVVASTNVVASADPVAPIAVGTVEIATGSTASMVFKNTAGVVKATQAISTANDKCSLTPVTGPVGAWSATNGVPSYYQAGIGVSGIKATGTACGRIDPSPDETLTLKLNGSALPAQLSSPLARWASLDVEFKGGATVVATLKRGGAAVDTYTIVTGTAAPATPPANTQYCLNGSDSGPDSFSGDNCQWKIGSPTSFTAPFDEITLDVTVGSGASLKGGGDWAVPANHRSVFGLYAQPDGILDCNAGAQNVSPDSAEWSISVDRLTNGDSNEVCTPVPFSLRKDGSSATFRKPLDSQYSAQFVIDVVKKQVAATNPIAVIQVNWEDGAGAKDVVWCKDSYFVGTDTAGKPVVDYGVLKVVEADASNGSATSLPGFQFACLYKQSADLQADGSLITTDGLYVTGDIKFTTR